LKQEIIIIGQNYDKLEIDFDNLKITKEIAEKEIKKLTPIIEELHS